MSKRLCKSRTDIKIDGVCGGIAKYLNIDVTIIRIIWLILSVGSGVFPGVVIYFICMLIMPREDGYIDMREDDRANGN